MGTAQRPSLRRATNLRTTRYRYYSTLLVKEVSYYYISLGSATISLYIENILLYINGRDVLCRYFLVYDISTCTTLFYDSYISSGLKSSYFTCSVHVSQVSPSIHLSVPRTCRLTEKLITRFFIFCYLCMSPWANSTLHSESFLL